MSSAPVTIRPVQTKQDRKAFVDFAWEVYKDDPAWVPPLKDEVHGLITPGKNPWFEHAKAQLWLAERGGKVVGRISAQVDELVQQHMEAGTGNWGMFEVLDGEAAAALIATAEDWLRKQGMKRALGPISLSIWDEPGLEIEGFSEPPTAMMGHHRPEYRAWIEAAGYTKAKDLLTYEVDIAHWDDPRISRLIAMGEKQPAHPHPRDRQVEVRRGIAADPQPAQRSLVGQLGLCAADRGRDRLCRQEAEADHLQRAGPRRRSRRRAGRVHADDPGHQRADQGPQRRAVPVQLHQVALAPAEAADAARCGCR